MRQGREVGEEQEKGESGVRWGDMMTEVEIVIPEMGKIWRKSKRVKTHHGGAI